MRCDCCKTEFDSLRLRECHSCHATFCRKCMDQWQSPVMCDTCLDEALSPEQKRTRLENSHVVRGL